MLGGADEVDHRFSSGIVVAESHSNLGPNRERRLHLVRSLASAMGIFWSSNKSQWSLSPKSVFNCGRHKPV